MTSPSPAAPAVRRAALSVLVGLVAVLGGALGAAPATAADAPALTVTGLKAHYHSDRPIEIAVTQTPASSNAHYHWYHRCGTATDWTVVPGASATLKLTAGPALHDCDLVVRLFGDQHEVLAESAPATIVVDDHGAGPALPVLTVAGLRDHYHSDSPIELHVTADPAPAADTAHYSWVQRCGTDAPWTAIPKATTSALALTAAPALDGCEIAARHYGVVSAPVTVEVDDHDDHGPVATTLSVTGLREQYAPGDAIALRAAQDPATDLDHHHWFVRCGSGEWTVEPNNATAAWDAVADARHDGCQVQARLYDHDHEVVAESAPVTLRVAAPAPAPAAPLPVAPGAPAPAAPVAPAPTGVPAASSVVLRPSAVRTARGLLRQRVLRSTVRLNGAAKVAVRATISAAAARWIGLRVPKGARTVALGTGRTTKTTPGSAVVRIALAAKHRRALKKVRGTLRIALTATVTTKDGRTITTTRATTVRG